MQTSKFCGFAIFSGFNSIVDFLLLAQKTMNHQPALVPKYGWQERKGHHEQKLTCLCRSGYAQAGFPLKTPLTAPLATCPSCLKRATLFVDNPHKGEI